LPFDVSDRRRNGPVWHSTRSIPILLLLIAATYGLYSALHLHPPALLPLYPIAGIGGAGAALASILMIRVPFHRGLPDLMDQLDS
jgi:hypothetical protein